MATEVARPRRARWAWLEAVGSQALALVGAFAFAAALGSIIIIAYGESPFFVYRVVWEFSTARLSDLARVLAIATPLIFSGLAVAVAFKAGLFNIGVEGQYRVGMAAAAAGAATLGFLPGPLLLFAVVLCAVAGSMLWAWLPAFLKVKTGAHEVVTTIMMNGIATSLVGWAILHPLRTAERGLVDLRTAPFPDNALIPTISESLGLQESIPPSAHLTWLFVIAALACVAVWFVMYRSRLGYEVRAVGSSAGSAEAGGISIGATQIKVFLISGALAGFVGLNHILGDKGYLGSNYEGGLGFAGIAVAFLGRNHPAGVFLAAILVGMLQRGQDGVAVTTDLPTEILIILQGLLILSVVIAYELVNRALTRRRQRLVRAEELSDAPA
ncbi:MAG: ABC transporter permease [Actinomycetota bacterium]